MSDRMMDVFHATASATMRKNGYKFDAQAIEAGVRAVARAAVYAVADEYSSGHQSEIPHGLDMRVNLPKWMRDYAERHYGPTPLNTEREANA